MLRRLTILVLVMLLAAGCAPATPLTTRQPATAQPPAPTSTGHAATPVPTWTATLTPPATATVAPRPTSTPTAAVPPRVVVSEFFYWYDAATGAHMDAAAPLSLTLPDGALPNWRDPDWFAREFSDMGAAGIDIAACSYWPGEAWADDALPHLVAALDTLNNQGINAPGVAMFYETVPLWGVDLTSDSGQETLFTPIRRFFGAVPERHWGRIDGRPVIWFYDNGGGNIARYDQGTFDFLYRQFDAEFGIRPYIVLDRSWISERQIEVDGIYTWGVAFLGFQPRDSIAGAGPGYDDHRIPDRTTPILVPRDNGGWYGRNLSYALASGRHVLWLETWNEHHEATNLNHTAEYGRQYIDLTRYYVERFKRGEMAPKPLPGPYATATVITATLNGPQGLWEGLQMLDVAGDGLWESTAAAGTSARSTAGEAPGRYLYFAIDDSFAFFDAPVDVRIEVEYLDAGTGRLILEYDSYEPTRPDRLEDRYRALSGPLLRDSGAWKTTEFVVKGARFANGQNGGADFRLWADVGHDLTVQRVTVSRLASP